MGERPFYPRAGADGTGDIRLWTLGAVGPISGAWEPYFNEDKITQREGRRPRSGRPWRKRLSTGVEEIRTAERLNMADNCILSRKQRQWKPFACLTWRTEKGEGEAQECYLHPRSLSNAFADSRSSFCSDPLALRRCPWPNPFKRSCRHMA